MNRNAKSIVGLLVVSACSAAWVDTAVGNNDVVIAHTVNFSELDGGTLDGDGADDGVFTCKSLTVRSTGAIVINEDTSEFAVDENVVLQNSGAIRTPSIVTIDRGPVIRLVVGNSFLMSGTSLLRSHGRMFGGSIQVTTIEDIKLTQSAKIEAHGTAAGTGGSISLYSGDSLRLVNSTNRVTANGFHGGFVELISEEDACVTIYINAVVNAVGFNGEGGEVRIFAFNGGITIAGDPGRIAASGTGGADGSVLIFTDLTVTPNPVHSQPEAVVMATGQPCPQ